MGPIEYIKATGKVEDGRYLMGMAGVPQRDGSVADETPYLVKNLFTEPTGNAKLGADDGEGGYYIIGLSLAPSRENGLTNAKGQRINLCHGASKGCIGVCLYGSGNARAGKGVRRARVAKSRLWVRDREAFKSLVVAELVKYELKAVREGRTLVVRLNVFSDVQWEREFPELFTMFPDVQFYDYTKLAGRIGKTAPNYHLTFSRSETNHDVALAMLARGVNVAVVFEDETFPATWNGYQVVNGAHSDLRILDPRGPRGVVVALAEKDTANGKRTKSKKNPHRNTEGFILPTATSNHYNQPITLA